MSEPILLGSLNQYNESYQKVRLEEVKSLLSSKGIQSTKILQKHRGYQIFIIDSKFEIEKIPKKYSCTFGKDKKYIFLPFKDNNKVSKIVTLMQIIAFLVVMLFCLYIQLFNKPNRYGYLRNILPFISILYNP